MESLPFNFNFSDYIQLQGLLAVLRAVALVLIGGFLVYVLAYSVKRTVAKRAGEHEAMVARKAVLYTGLGLLLISLLSQLGFDLGALLATAGVASVAIGFAAQTSLSNLISGMFLLAEKPFQAGDLIRVDGTLGIVISVDLLSIKIRKLDNIFVRIPNETIIKTQVENITRYPIRRLDLRFRVPYSQDITHVSDVLKEIATGNPYCLDEPEPLILMADFGPHSLEFLFGIWFQKDNFIKLKTSIQIDMMNRFRKEGIEFAVPHVAVQAASQSGAVPIRMTEGEQ